jgi:hypothetical protein
MKLPRVGDRVVVPFGGRDKEGEVTHVSATPPMVEVELWLEGGDEPMRFTYRAERVGPAQPVRQ